MEILKCFTSTHHGILIGGNLGEQLSEKRKKLHQLLQFPEEDQKYLPVWTNKTYLLGNVNRVGVNHETHHVLEQICKHMHIPEIKSISKRSRLHAEASKELKLGLSSFARFFSLHALLLCYPWYPSSFSMHLGDSYMENKVLLAMSTCAAQPAFSSKCWGMVTKNTTLETLPCTHQTLIFQAFSTPALRLQSLSMPVYISVERREVGCLSLACLIFCTGLVTRSTCTKFCEAFYRMLSPKEWNASGV